MFSTERYEISFTGIEDNRFNLDTVTNNWRIAAETVNRETGLYINAQISERMIVCNNCCVSERAIVANVTRNPISEKNDSFFYVVLQEVVNLTKAAVGNVSTVIVKVLVDVSIL
ncbi:MAG TPA: hypothetical protein DHW61_18885 [Lachnoclostridium phytofermentans]|uniref:Uncharacterized protein n=1 Tax=Lachnoclostridium phytofermentans TaxID=66219 RepID=A0A3D2XCW8_9FIRM|nr:hypothetical protein [Lachnoclostridium sp.]HCL04443.1 hypothetical protein [Lachnoclostridium phytofermentans]